MVWRPWKSGTLSDKYAYIQSLYKDNFYTSELYGENLSEISDKATKQRLMDGNWEYDEGDNSLIEYAAISDIWTNSLETDDNELTQKWATVDVARFGQDRTVVMLWKGLRAYKIIVWREQPLNITADKIKDVLRDEKIPYSHVVIDEVGVGGGVIDQLKGVNGFIANSSPMENPEAPKTYQMKNGEMKGITARENFGSLKDQCSYMLAEKINSHQVAMDCEEVAVQESLEEELGQIKRRDPDKDGKLRVIPKEDVIESIGRSPDLSDCMIMRMYFILNKTGKTGKKGLSGQATKYR
jgi:hypothetical protein